LELRADVTSRQVETTISEDKPAVNETAPGPRSRYGGSQMVLKTSRKNRNSAERQPSVRSKLKRDRETVSNTTVYNIMGVAASLLIENSKLKLIQEVGKLTRLSSMVLEIL
jgi:hypothetical protein